MSKEKLEMMFKLLEKSNFEIVQEIPSNFKCVICSKILNDARQGACGCRYCRKCADRFVHDSNGLCPGGTDDCCYISKEALSPDIGMNRDIGRLKARCIEDGCGHECTLAELGEHLRLCGRRGHACPFAVLGCGHRSLQKNGPGEPLSLATEEHLLTVVDVVVNVKNEMAGLKSKEEQHKTEILSLTENLSMKNDLINSLKNEILIIKGDYGRLLHRIDNLEQNLEEKINQILETKLKEEIKKIEERNRIFQMILVQKVKCWIESSYDSFVWEISEVSEKRQKNELIGREMYYSKVNRCQIQLTFSANSNSESVDISLRFFSNPENISLVWPLKAEIIIKIINKFNPIAFKVVKKQCEIEEPVVSSYECSEAFEFCYSELIRDGILQGNCFLIQCLIEFH